MTIGKVFYVAAAILFFVAAVGMTFIPNPTNWGLLCVALGLLLDGYRFNLMKR